jgi:hypothetical protein
MNSRRGTADGRTVHDAQGETWHVYEVGGATYDRRASLIFESAWTVRRVRIYPANWRTLSDEELLALSWQA